jgi:hypothetical protein
MAPATIMNTILIAASFSRLLCADYKIQQETPHEKKNLKPQGNVAWRCRCPVLWHWLTGLILGIFFSRR